MWPGAAFARSEIMREHDVVLLCMRLALSISTERPHGEKDAPRRSEKDDDGSESDQQSHATPTGELQRHTAVVKLGKQRV